MTLDGRAVPGLERDDSDQSYISLYSAEERAGVLIPLVTADQPGSHTLRLTIAAQGEPASLGNRVVIDALEVRSGERPSASLLPLFAGLGALVVVVLALLLALRRLGVLPRQR